MKLGVTFPDRRNGLVHIRGRLKLKTGMPIIQVSFRRAAFERWLRSTPFVHNTSPLLVPLAWSLFWRLMRTASEYKGREWEVVGARKARWIHDPLPQKLRRSRLTIRDTYLHDQENPRNTVPPLNYTVNVTRQDLALIDQDGTRAHTEIVIMLTTPALQGALRRPRGARANAGELLRPVRAALLEAEWLCKLAADPKGPDVTVLAQVQHALGKDFDPHPRRWRQNAIMLVSRAFRGAWAKYHVKPLEARTEGDAGDVYRQLLPAGRRKTLRAALSALPDEMETIHKEWHERLLGPAGKAASDFDLI